MLFAVGYVRLSEMAGTRMSAQWIDMRRSYHARIDSGTGWLGDALIENVVEMLALWQTHRNAERSPRIRDAARFDLRSRASHANRLLAGPTTAELRGHGTTPIHVGDARRWSSTDADCMADERFDQKS